MLLCCSLSSEICVKNCTDIVRHVFSFPIIILLANDFMISLFRGLLFQTYFLILTFIMGIGGLFLRLFRLKKAGLRYAQAWSSAVLWGFKIFCGVKLEISGLENIPKTAALIAPQHQSFFDGFIWMILLKNPAYIIKKELVSIPLVGPMLVLSGMLPIDRSAGAKSIRLLQKTVQDSWEKERQVIIFPQGTRTDPGEKIPPQKGIIALSRIAETQQIPLIPVAINSGLFWPKSGISKHKGVLKIVIGKSLSFEEMSQKALPDILEKSWENLEVKSGITNTYSPLCR
ncbi:1-acyl-sn-glycerol-3-phosphate acyltransferase [Acetobacteraceae bacterium]|nr:1-acyl-sn-glycerol-3-phosphate acyltransferase [Acetobacteraceae bacterium]